MLPLYRSSFENDCRIMQDDWMILLIVLFATENKSLWRYNAAHKDIFQSLPTACIDAF
jgi:hypothetical protein